LVAVKAWHNSPADSETSSERRVVWRSTGGLRGFGFGKQGKETAKALAKKTLFDDPVFRIGVGFRGMTDP